MITGSPIIFMTASTSFVTYTTQKNLSALLSKGSNSGQRRRKLVCWTSMLPFTIAVLSKALKKQGIGENTIRNYLRTQSMNACPSANAAQTRSG
jgi:hypothetical protein